MQQPPSPALPFNGGYHFGRDVDDRLQRPRAVRWPRLRSGLARKRGGDLMSSNDETSTAPLTSKRATQIAQLEEKLRQLKAREQAV